MAYTFQFLRACAGTRAGRPMDSSIIDQRRAGWMTHAPCARRSRVHVRAGFLRIAMAAAAALATLTLAPARAEAQVTSYAFVPNHNAGTMSVIDTRAAATTGAAVPVG